MVKCFLNPVASLFCVVLVIAPSLFRLFEIYIVSVTSLSTLMSVRLNGLMVNRLVGLSACHNFLTGREVRLPCTFRGTYFVFIYV